jgi:predicted methyltransferase
MRTIRLIFSTLCLCLLTQQATAQFGPPPTPLQQAVQSAMQSDIRTEAERLRDQNRQPAQVLDFFRLEDDMKVIEILPFSGWYSKLLAPVLYDSGKLYVVHPPGFYADAFQPVLELDGMDRVEVIDWNAPAGGTGFFGASGEWDVEPVDMVLTFRNYHNFSVEDRAAVDKSVYDALKPGGLYGVIDHTRRHMEPSNSENGRRVDPVAAVLEIQQAGFTLVDYSDVLSRSDDELRYEVGKRTVTGNTDRFTLLFMKPLD